MKKHVRWYNDDMNKERLHIVLNKDIIDQLNLASGQELEAELYADKLVLQREE